MKRESDRLSGEEVQEDLDHSMETCNNERTNQGKYCQGRTPMQIFEDGRTLYQKYVFKTFKERKCSPISAKISQSGDLSASAGITQGDIIA